MKINLLTKFAILTVSLATSITAFADVKIKSRQTVSGQTMENTVLIKGKRERTESMNGQMISVMQCDLRRDIKINPASQTYQISPFDISNGGNSAVQNQNSKIQSSKGGLITMLVTNKDTGERKQMFGYTAKHIVTTMETNSSPDACSLTKSKTQIDGWYIDADFALDCATNRVYANNNQQTGGCQDKTDIKTVGAAVKKGYPVTEKMTMFDENGKESFTTTNEVVELSKTTLDAALFDVPKDFREVKSTSELFAGNSMNLGGNSSMKTPNSPNGGAISNDNSGMNQTVKNLSQNSNKSANETGAKKDGTIRIGLPTVKTGAVGEGINAQELAGAIQNTLGAYLKGSKVELVPLEAKLASALDNEAKEKQCDFVLYATVSHKKGGGGGFGKMFGSVAPLMGAVIPGAGIVGAVAGSVASTAISTAANASSNVKAKDELTLDVKIQNGANVAFTKQYKAKAKSAGEDLISPMIEQAAQQIIDAVAK